MATQVFNPRLRHFQDWNNQNLSLCIKYEENAVQDLTLLLKRYLDFPEELLHEHMVISFLVISNKGKYQIDVTFEDAITAKTNTRYFHCSLDTATKVLQHLKGAGIKPSETIWRDMRTPIMA